MYAALKGSGCDAMLRMRGRVVRIRQPKRPSCPSERSIAVVPDRQPSTPMMAPRGSAHGAPGFGSRPLKPASPRMTGAPTKQEIDEPTGNFLRVFELLASVSRTN